MKIRANTSGVTIFAYFKEIMIIKISNLTLHKLGLLQNLFFLAIGFQCFGISVFFFSNFVTQQRWQSCISSFSQIWLFKNLKIIKNILIQFGYVSISTICRIMANLKDTKEENTQSNNLNQIISKAITCTCLKILFLNHLS